MALFAILCALLIEQVYPLPMRNPVYRAHQAFTAWVARTLDVGRPVYAWVCCALAVALPALLVALVYKALTWLGWPLGWLWAALVLYFTLGFRQFSGHITAIRDALDVGDEISARQLLAQWKQVNAADLPRSDILRQVLEHAVRDVHRHVFGVIVAFVVCAAFGLGPAGAVLFRCAEFVRRAWKPCQGVAETMSGARPACAQAAWNAINWLPARTTAMVFAAAGNFEQAVDNWRQAASQLPEAVLASSDDIVLAAGLGAIDLPWPLSGAAQGVPPRLPAPAATAGAQETSAQLPEQTAPFYGMPPPPDMVAPCEPVAAAAAGAVQSRAQPQMQHVQHLVGLVWRAVVLWAGLIALVTVTRWVAG